MIEEKLMDLFVNILIPSCMGLAMVSISLWWLNWLFGKLFNFSSKTSVESEFLEILKEQNNISRKILSDQALLLDCLVSLRKLSSSTMEPEKTNGEAGQPAQGDKNEPPPFVRAEAASDIGGNAEKSGAGSNADGNNA